MMVTRVSSVETTPTSHQARCADTESVHNVGTCAVTMGSVVNAYMHGALHCLRKEPPQ
jgi:hypothetical protein